MNELQKNQILEILKKQLNSIQCLKNEFFRDGNYVKAAQFRDYEKQLEVCVSLINGDKIEGVNVENTVVSQTNTELNFSDELAEIIGLVNKPISTRKLVLTILSQKNSVSQKLIELDVSVQSVIKKLNTEKSNDFIKTNNLDMTYFASKAFKTCFLEARYQGKDEVTLEILFMSILRNVSDKTIGLLGEFGIEYSTLK